MNSTLKVGISLAWSQHISHLPALAFPQVPTLSCLPLAKAVTTLDKLGSALVIFQPFQLTSLFTVDQLSHGQFADMT